MKRSTLPLALALLALVMAAPCLAASDASAPESVTAPTPATMTPAGAQDGQVVLDPTAGAALTSQYAEDCPDTFFLKVLYPNLPVQACIDYCAANSGTFAGYVDIGRGLWACFCCPV